MCVRVSVRGREAHNRTHTHTHTHYMSHTHTQTRTHTHLHYMTAVCRNCVIIYSNKACDKSDQHVTSPVLFFSFIHTRRVFPARCLTCSQSVSIIFFLFPIDLVTRPIHVLFLSHSLSLYIYMHIHHTQRNTGRICVALDTLERV